MPRKKQRLFKLTSVYFTSEGIQDHEILLRTLQFVRDIPQHLLLELKIELDANTPPDKIKEFLESREREFNVGDLDFINKW